MKQITLSTLKEATPQQVFDQSAKHLLEQGAQSNKRPDGFQGCAYRGTDGLMCAAGCFISEEEYDPNNMEGKDWLIMAKANEVPQDHMYLIRDLQIVHDGRDVLSWKEELAAVAKRYKLEHSHVTGLLA